MADDYETTLVQLEQSLQAQHIAQRPLMKLPLKASLDEARAIAALHTVNNLPVVDQRQGIAGVLENLNGEIDDYACPPDDGTAGSAMRPLTDRMLVEGSCSLERLLADLLEPPYYQLVVTAGNIDAIVTVADLNKAPLRGHGVCDRRAPGERHEGRDPRQDGWR